MPVQALVEGQVVGVPTETVYGLAVDALSETAIEELFRLKELKGREGEVPLAISVGSREAAEDFLCEAAPGREAARVRQGARAGRHDGPVGARRLATVCAHAAAPRQAAAERAVAANRGRAVRAGDAVAQGIAAADGAVGAVVAVGVAAAGLA